MATYNSTWQQAQEDRLKKLTTYPSASVVQQEYRVAVFTVTFPSGASSDTLVLGKLGVAKHRVLTDRIKVYGGASWSTGDLTLTLKRAPLTVGAEGEATLGTGALDGDVKVVTLAQSAPSVLQPQGGKDDIYYVTSILTGGSAPAGSTLTFEVPYYFEGV